MVFGCYPGALTHLDTLLLQADDDVRHPTALRRVPVSGPFQERVLLDEGPGLPHCVLMVPDGTHVDIAMFPPYETLKRCEVANVDDGGRARDIAGPVSSPFQPRTLVDVGLGFPFGVGLAPDRTDVDVTGV